METETPTTECTLPPNARLTRAFENLRMLERCWGGWVAGVWWTVVAGVFDLMRRQPAGAFINFVAAVVFAFFALRDRRKAEQLGADVEVVTLEIDRLVDDYTARMAS